MLARLFSVIRPNPLAALAVGAGPRPDHWPARGEAGRGSGAGGFADGHPANDAASRFRALAECCADGLTALAYAQFADLLELPPSLRLRAVRTMPAVATVPAARRHGVARR